MLPLIIAAAVSASMPNSAPTAARELEQGPSGAAVLRYYPLRAQRMLQAGEVVLHCAVSDQGAVSACKVASETPAGWDFGQAALQLAPLFKMKPAANGGAARAEVDIPIHFKISDEPSKIEAAMQCYAAYADPKIYDPTSSAATRPAYYFATRVMVEAVRIGESPAQWEARLAKARSDYTDAAKLAEWRTRCTLPPAAPAPMPTPARPN